MIQYKVSKKRERTLWRLFGKGLPDVLRLLRPIQVHDSWFTAFLLTIAAVTLGYALQISNGTLHPRAIFWLTIAFAACVIGIVIRPLRSRLEIFGEKILILLLGSGLIVEFLLLFTSVPGMYLQVSGPKDYVFFMTSLIFAALLISLGLAGIRWADRIWFPPLLFIHFLLGVWLIKMSPSPFIDVYVFQRDASATLLRGINPYTITFPDIYGGNSPFYGPGISVNGRLTFGFPYPPLSLFLALSGYVLGGDLRYAQLAALVLAGVFMAYARPGRVASLAAALFLFTPRVFFVLEQSWTEPFLVLLLAATVFCACRAPRAMPFVFGLFLSIKQYTVFAVLLIFLLLPRPLRLGTLTRLLVIAGLIALAVTLPLALWDLSAFIHDVVVLHFYQPFRQDALSYIAWYVWLGGSIPPVWLAFVAMISVTVIALRRAAHTPSGFAAANALVFFAFFALNKQAFCNYYFFVVGALCCAIAAMQPHRHVARNLSTSIS